MRENQYVLWNRGQWRGWAVGFVSSLRPEITKVRTAHLGNLSWVGSALEKDATNGTVFLVNPDQVTRLIATQLQGIDFEKDQTLQHLRDSAVRDLISAARTLEILRAGREKQVETEQVKLIKEHKRKEE